MKSFVKYCININIIYRMYIIHNNIHDLLSKKKNNIHDLRIRFEYIY